MAESLARYTVQVSKAKMPQGGRCKESADESRSHGEYIAGREVYIRANVGLTRESLVG